MSKFKFTSKQTVEAPSMEEAKEIFANNSFDFAANAECEEINEDPTVDHDGIYALVLWPDVQEFMDEPWFETEAILSSEGSANYFIPIKRL